MTALPASSTATAGTATEGDVKNFLATVRTFIADLLGTDSANKVAALTALGAVFNGSSSTKTGAYTVATTDRGKVIRCNGTFTVTLPAAATLADGFVFAVWNLGSGTITIDPDLSELIDGATTKTVRANTCALVFCDGSAFSTMGSFAMGTGSGLDADKLDGQHGTYYAPATGGNYVAKDANGGVGTFRLGTNPGGAYNIGDSASGATFGIGSGTWRIQGLFTTTSDGVIALCQRIA